MGACGSLEIFSTRRLVDPVGTAKHLSALLGADRCSHVTRFPESHPWEEFQESLRYQRENPDPPDREFRVEDYVQIVDLNDEQVAEEYAAADAGKFYLPGTTLHIDLKRCPFDVELDHAWMTIPESIRDTCMPAGTSIVLGPHDLCEATENSNGTFFGRATVAISVYLQLAPLDWEHARRLALALPIVVQTQRKMAAILGDAESCIYWNA